jgi:tripartite-type tricarboxylate transporter receptor subunit TctC
MRHFTLLATVASITLGAVGFGTTAFAQDYPQRPVSLIVGYAPGGPVDTSARTFAKYLGDKLGQTIVVENKSGASGIIAAEYVAKAAPDGYTLYFTASPTMTMSPLVQRSTRFDPRTTFKPIGLVNNYTNVLLVGNDFPAKTVGELIAYAKKNPEAVTFGSAGIGASNHLSAELMKRTTGAPMMHVPYRGNSPAMLDVMSGKISFMFDISSTAKVFVDGGKARALAVTSRERNAGLPDVPTMIEAGVPDFDVTGWYAVVAPKELPDAIQQTLVKAVTEVTQDPEYRKTMENGGYTLLKPNPAELQSRIEKEYALWKEVIEEAKITAE